MFVREVMYRINRPRRDWEPRVIEVRSLGHYARTRAVIGLISAGVGNFPGRFPEDTMWSMDGSCELRGLPWELQPNTRDMPNILADVMAPPLRPKHVQGQSIRNFYVLNSGIAMYVTTPDCRACTCVSSGVKLSTQQSDKCRQKIVKEAQEYDEDRLRAFLGTYVPSRPAPVLTGGGSAEPAVVETAEIPVRTFGAASSSSSGGAQPSPMETRTEERKRGHSSGSAPVSAGIPEQRQAKRVRFEVSEEPSRDVKKGLSTKPASETDAEELELDNSERPSSSSGVVIPSDVPMGGTRYVGDVNASLGAIGRQDGSQFPSSCEFQFGERKVQLSADREDLLEPASIQVRDAFRQ